MLKGNIFLFKTEEKYINAVYVHDNSSGMLILFEDGKYLSFIYRSEYHYGTYQITNNKLIIRHNLPDGNVEEMTHNIDDNYEIENYKKLKLEDNNLFDKNNNYLESAYFSDEGTSVIVLFSNGDYFLGRERSEYFYGTYEIKNNKLIVKYHLMDDSIEEKTIDINDNYEIKNYKKIKLEN